MKKKVLVVDDDPMMTELMEEVLGMAYDVLTAHSKSEAAKILKDKNLQCVISDIEMSGKNSKDGFELLEIIKSDPLFSQLPVIIMSGHDLEIEASAKGATAFLGKPIILKELLDILNLLVRV